MKINNESSLAKAMGIKVVHLSYGYARSELQVDESHLNWLKTAHGGVIWTLADHTAGALGSAIGKGVVNLQTSFNFVSKVEPAQKIVAEARLVKETSRTIVVKTTVSTAQGDLVGMGVITGLKL